MTPLIEMSREMCGHGALVFGDQDPALSFHPQKDRRIICTKRQVVGLANANHIQDVDIVFVMSLNGSPDSTGYVLIQ